MPRINYIESSGATRTIEAEAGLTLMEAAKLNNVMGIEAICEGMCSCATCHCYIDSKWHGLLPKASAMETAMLEQAVLRTADSRLSCQIVINEDLEDIIVIIPAAQANTI